MNTMSSISLRRACWKRTWAKGAVFVAAFFLVGCVNLTAVRDFAAEAKSLAGYNAVPADFVNTNVRMQALYGREEPQEQLAPIKDYQKLFEERQAVLVKYMGALASLADDDVTTYKKNIDEAAAAATKSGVVEKADADVFASVANLIAKVATDGARQRLLRDIVTRCDPAVQRLTAAMAETVRLDYGDSLRREQKAADSLLSDASAAKEQGLTRLAQFTMREHSIALAERQKSAEAFAAALTKVAEGHAKLARHIGDFSAKEFIAEIKGYQDDIKELRNQLRN
jgi:hypothetical protein